MFCFNSLGDALIFVVVRGGCNTQSLLLQLLLLQLLLLPSPFPNLSQL
jgi:hypothetical protein